MPRKKKSEMPFIEKVEGNVEGVTSAKEAAAIREKAKEENTIAIDYSQIPTDTKAATAVLTTAFRRMRQTPGLRYFGSGAELQGAVDAFFEMIFQAETAGIQIVPDVELLASFLGVTRRVLMTWIRGDANPEFVQVLDLALNDIATGKKQYALQNKVAPLIYLSDMQNNHGYLAQQTKQDVQISVRAETLSEKQLIENANLLP